MISLIKPGNTFVYEIWILSGLNLGEYFCIVDSVICVKASPSISIE